MITAEDIQRLVKLKAKDKDAFTRLIEELRSAHPLDHLLSYTKFKEYESNVTISRQPGKVARSKAVRSKP